MSLLQRKNVAVKQLALCSKMDLVAVVYVDGNLSIFRTISWERILITKYSDEVEARPDGGYILTFGPSGNVLTLAGRSASILDITNNRFSQVGEDISEELYYIDIYWMEAPNLTSPMNTSYDQSLKSNGSNILEKGFLFSALNDFSVAIYQYGMIPIMKTALSGEVCSINNSLLFGSDNVLSMTTIQRPAEKQFFVFSKSDMLQTVTIANVIFDLKTLVQSIKDNQNNIARRWKEALRVFPAKVELMNSALKGYEMNNGVVDFFHTIVLCGLWHPVASVIFSQHWNEQSLSRLRSTLDSTIKYIQRSIQLQIIPSIESMISLTRLAVESVSPSWPHLDKWRQFSQQCFNLLQSADMLLHEVSRVSIISQKVLLFFRSCMIEASANSTTTASHCALVSEDRKILQEVFSGPRNIPSTNPEYLFGTNILQLLSPDIPRSTSSVPYHQVSSPEPSLLDEAVQSIIQLDPVPHFARQLKMVVEAHDKLRVVYDPVAKSPIVRINTSVENWIKAALPVMKVFATNHYIAEKFSSGDPSVLITAIVAERTDSLGLRSYEMIVWKEEYNSTGMEVKICRRKLLGTMNDSEDETATNPWARLFVKKSGGVLLLMQDGSDCESVLLYELIDEDIEYDSITMVSPTGSASQTLSAKVKLPVNGNRVGSAEYNEARGIFTLICPGILFVFDENAEEDEEGEDENISESENDKSVDSSAMSDT